MVLPLLLSDKVFGTHEADHAVEKRLPPTSTDSVYSLWVRRACPRCARGLVPQPVFLSFWRRNYGRLYICLVVRNHLHYLSIPWKFHGTPRNTMDCHGMPWNAMQAHGTPWNFHGVPRRPTVSPVCDHGTPWHSTEAHGIAIYHGVLWGSTEISMAIFHGPPWPSSTAISAENSMEIQWKLYELRFNFQFQC